MAHLETYVVAMQKQGVLLPRASVAEIIPYEPLQRIDETPVWFLGILGWRGLQVPVVSFEMLTVERASFSLVSVASASLVIVNGMTDPNGLPFYALVGQTMPRLVNLTEEMLFATGEEPGRTERARVRFEDQVIAVPNLDFVEAAVTNVLVAND